MVRPGSHQPAGSLPFPASFYARTTIETRKLRREREVLSVLRVASPRRRQITSPLHPLSRKPVSAGKKVRRVHFFVPSRRSGIEAWQEPKAAPARADPGSGGPGSCRSGWVVAWQEPKAAPDEGQSGEWSAVFSPLKLSQGPTFRRYGRYPTMGARERAERTTRALAGHSLDQKRREASSTVESPCQGARAGLGNRITAPNHPRR
jgi:hypothetical protein